MQSWIIVFIAAVAMPPVMAAEISAACKPLLSAMQKTVLSDHTATSTQGGTTVKGITVGGVTYLQMHGKWITSKYTPQDAQKQSEENLREAKLYTCEKIADSTIDGVAVDNYRAHSESEDATTDSTISIAKSSGLAVRVDSDIDVGSVKHHYTTNYSYTNVRAPGG